MSREEDRQNKRVTPACSVGTDPLGCVTKPNSRRIHDACGDVVLPDPCNIDVTKFFEPEPPTTPDLVTPALPVVVIFNSETSAACSQLPGATGSIIGAASTAPAGSVAVSVYFAGIADVTLLQRRHLASIPQESLDTWPTLSASEIAEAGQLTMTQAQSLLAAFSSAQTIADENANALALSRLNCVYENTEQTANCPPGASAVAGVISVTTPAGAYTSKISQADADAQALAFASSGLRCLWTNAQRDATCAVVIPDAGPNAPINFVYSPGALPDPDAQVNSATVPAGTVTSPTSAEDASAVAAAMAASFLNCFYLNEEQEGVCSGVYHTSSYLHTVSAGFVVSRDSFDVANDQAEAIALAQTICRYGNEATSVTCDHPQNPNRGLGKDADNNYKKAAPSPISPVYEVTIGLNSIISEVSVDDANSQAETLALAQLVCVWCNSEVGSTCAPDSTPSVSGSVDETDPVLANTYCASSYLLAQDLAVAASKVTKRAKTLGADSCRYENDPIYAKCYIQGAPPAPFSTYTPVSKVVSTIDNPYTDLSAASQAQTAIVARGAIVTSDKATANATATAIARAQLDCYYENSDVPCPAGASGELVAAGTVRSEVNKAAANTIAKGLLYCYVESASTTQTCADIGKAGASANGVVTVPAAKGVITLTVDPDLTPAEVTTTQTAANNQAIVYARSQLNCFYESAEIRLLCGAAVDTESTVGPADTIASGAGYLQTDPAQTAVSPNSLGAASNPVVIPARSHVSTENQLTANRTAYTEALARLNCFYESVSKNHYCADKDNVSSNSVGSATNPVVTPAGQFTSTTSQTNANDQRDAYAVAQLDCFYESAAKTYYCSDNFGPGTPDYYEGQKNKQNVSSNSVGSTANPVVTEVGQFTSTTSQDNANAQRDAYAVAQLDCFYDSAEIKAYCGALVSGSYEQSPDSPTNHTITIGDGILAEYLPVSPNSLGYKDGSGTDNPVEVEARTYQSYSDQNSANLMALTQAIAQLNCFYESAKIRLFCGASSFDSLSAAVQKTQPEDSGEITSGDGTVASPTERVSRYSLGYKSPGGVGAPPDAPAEITARSYQAPSQTEANRKAYADAISRLDCFYENASINLLCDTDDNLGTGTGTEYDSAKFYSPDHATNSSIAIGTGQRDGVAVVSDKSNGHTSRPVTVGARTTRSYASQSEANLLAFTIARSQLNCFYLNAAVNTESSEISCDPGLEKLTDGEVGAGQIVSWTSQDHANNLARTLAKALMVCVNPEEVGGTIGTPGASGSDGLSVNCSNTCVGFYAS